MDTPLTKLFKKNYLFDSSVVGSPNWSELTSDLRKYEQQIIEDAYNDGRRDGIDRNYQTLAENGKDYFVKTFLAK